MRHQDRCQNPIEVHIRYRFDGLRGKLKSLDQNKTQVARFDGLLTLIVVFSLEVL